MNSFIKTLNVIYYDKNERATKYFSDKMQNYVQNLFLTKNINEIVHTYDKLSNEDIRLDAVICNTNSIDEDSIKEAVNEIRDVNSNVPFMLIINNEEKMRLLDTLEHNVTGYLSKSLDINKLFKKIEVCCNFYHKNDSVLKRKEELENYLKLIDKVAIIIRTNTKGKLVYANDLFFDNSKYSKDINLNSIPLLKLLDIPKETFSTINHNVKKGITWDGVLKLKAKDKSNYYVNTTIIPMLNEKKGKITEFICVGFLVTQDELNKKDFRKKVMTSFQNFRNKENQYVDLIKNLERKIEKFTTAKSQNEYAQMKLKSYEEANAKLRNQISFYEKSLKEQNEKHEKYVSLANEKMNSLFKNNKFLITENQKLKHLNKSCNVSNSEKDEEIKNLQKRVFDKNLEIEKLQDIIAHLEEKYGHR